MVNHKEYEDIVKRQDSMHEEIFQMQLWMEKDWDEILELKDKVDFSEVE